MQIRSRLFSAIPVFYVSRLAESYSKELDEDDLQQLLCDIADMDPDNTMLPVGFRQRDQTTKEPTGELNRDTLMSFLEEEGAAIPDKVMSVKSIYSQKLGNKYIVVWFSSEKSCRYVIWNRR